MAVRSPCRYGAAGSRSAHNATATPSPPAPVTDWTLYDTHFAERPRDRGTLRGARRATVVIATIRPVCVGPTQTDGKQR